MSAKKKQTTEEAAAPAMVTVEVINQPIYEDGERREKGARFQTTARRADALRHFVRIVAEKP